MTEMTKISYRDLRDAAKALTDFETTLGSLILADAIETMVAQEPRPSNSLSKAVAGNEKALRILKNAERKAGADMAVRWNTMGLSKDLAKIGPERIEAHLAETSYELSADRSREAEVMDKAAKILDFKARSSPFDRLSFKELFAPLQLDPETRRPIEKGEATRARAAAIGALCKLTPEIRAELTFWSASNPPSKKTRHYLRKIWGWTFTRRYVAIPSEPINASPNGGGTSSPAQTPAYSELRFNLHRVDCLDDTDGGEVGADEIELGGTEVSGMEDAPVDATVGIFGPLSAGSFSTGDDRSFSPPYVVNNWSLQGAIFPRTFLVNLVMSEKDMNEKFIEVLEDFAAASAGDMTALITAISAAAGTAAGAAIGTALGTSIAPLIGSLIGLVIGALVGLVSAWVSQAVNPEIFENVRSMAVILDGPHEFRDGSTSTPHETVTYLDHGAHYTVRCNFSLH
jgi:hypothetical protein